MARERFNKKNVLFYDYLNCYRVFYKFNDGNRYYLGDFRKGGKSLIYLEAKHTIEKILQGN